MFKSKTKPPYTLFRYYNIERACHYFQFKQPKTWGIDHPQCSKPEKPLPFTKTSLNELGHQPGNDLSLKPKNPPYFSAPLNNIKDAGFKPPQTPHTYGLQLFTSVFRTLSTELKQER